MSEFKGTKGEWKIGNGEIFRPASSGSISPYYKQICSIVNTGTDEYKANALLISKASLMLEMLKSVLEIQKSYIGSANIELVYKTKEIEQLIKEATEL